MFIEILSFKCFMENMPLGHPMFNFWLKDRFDCDIYIQALSSENLDNSLDINYTQILHIYIQDNDELFLYI